MSAANNLKVNGISSSTSNNNNNNNANQGIKNQFSNTVKLTYLSSNHNHLTTSSAHQQNITKGNNKTLNSVETIATIHHHHNQLQSQQQVAQHQLPIVSSTTASVTNQQRRSFNNLHSFLKNNNKNKNIIDASKHIIIPPQYQSPPQPVGGILKHLNASGPTERQINKTSSYFTELNTTSPHLNIKYPPEIPQLSAVYIPESVKLQDINSSRYFQQQQQQQQKQQQQQQSRHQISSSTGGTHLVLSSQQNQQDSQQQQHQHQEMLKFVRKSDQDQSSPNTPTTTPTGIPSTARLTAEQNRQLQSLITELRVLKEANQRLIDDNQELRDLCCFLDDDRQKGRKLAREWQRFGRYTASVMRQEVSAYQNKLRQLDDKQQELITDNLELKELCLYLDEERAHVAANTLCVNCGAPARPPLRDDGDGSSSSTNADETMSAIRNYERHLPDLHLRSTLSDQTLQYVRSLERRIHQLEEERLTTTTVTPTATTPNTTVVASQVTPTPEAFSGRPEAVVRALQVLEVREQLERDRLGNLTGVQIDQMDDGEKAIVREMCNVVWRKLEGGSPNGNGLDPL